MLIKTERDELENYLTDASNLRGGRAEKIIFPANALEVSEILRAATANETPVTVSGAGTGTVGGRIPHGGAIIALDKLNRIKEIGTDYGIVESGVILDDYQKSVDAKNLFYPPDPTEWSAQMGGTVVTNASGARSFKYGATRAFVERLEIVLPTGDIINLRRGEQFAGEQIRLKLDNKEIVAPMPTYKMPPTRKHAAGYFAKPGMDLIDLFIGSEGTLGVVTEIETRLIPKAENILSGVIFFQDEKNLLNFVSEAREISFTTRREIQNPKSKIHNPLDARVLEYFDRNALEFMRGKFSMIPENMAGAIFFEQESNAEAEEELLNQWFELLEKHNAETEKSWFATNAADLTKMREFRHALPVAVNEFIVRHAQKKVSTDIAVVDAEFPQMLRFYQSTLDTSGLAYVIFGHIGDNHVHVNILPRNEAEATTARHIYARFIARTCIIGGTISAEHGVGKLKKQFLEVMFGERYLNEMAAIKRAFDPAGILGRGIMFDEKYLN